MKKKKKKGMKWLLAALLVIVVLLVVCFALRRPSSKADAGSWSTEAISRGTIRITTEGNGYIEAAEEEAVSADYDLKIETVDVENGDMVEAGDIIARVDPDSVEDQIVLLTAELDQLNEKISGMDKSGSSSVTAPVSGRVKRIFVKEDEVLQEVLKDHGGMMELSVDGKLKVEFSSSEKLSRGEVVTVSFLNYEEEGIVVSEDNNVYTVTIGDDAAYHVDTEAIILDKNDAALGTGTLQSNHPYLVDARYGVADGINVSVGDYVEKGETLLTRTDNSYNQEYLDAVDDREEVMEKLQELRALKKSPEIRAEGSGIISELALLEHTPAAEGTVMYHLISTDSFWLKTQIDELDIANVEEGQKASVVFDAFEDESYEGTVKKVSAVGENVSGVTKYQVTIEVPGIEKVKLSMSATATIVIEEKTDVLLIPVDAVQNVDGQKCVTVIRENIQETVPVTLGLVNNTMAEVEEGLEEGDQILVEGTSPMEEMMSMIRSRSPFQGGEG